MALHLDPSIPASKKDPVLQDLSTTAAKLNAATKRLSETAIKVELMLKRMNLGVAAWVPLVDHEGGSTDEWLGYAKFNGRWGLIIRELDVGPHGDAESHKDVTFADATREARIRAIAQIPALFQKLNEEADELTTKLTGNIEFAEALVTAHALTNPSKAAPEAAAVKVRKI